MLRSWLESESSSSSAGCRSGVRVQRISEHYYTKVAPTRVQPQRGIRGCRPDVRSGAYRGAQEGAQAGVGVYRTHNFPRVNPAILPDAHSDPPSAAHHLHAQQYRAAETPFRRSPPAVSPPPFQAQRSVCRPWHRPPAPAVSSLQPPGPCAPVRPWPDPCFRRRPPAPGSSLRVHQREREHRRARPGTHL